MKGLVLESHDAQSATIEMLYAFKGFKLPDKDGRKWQQERFIRYLVLTEFADNVLAVRAIPGLKPTLLVRVLDDIQGLLLIPNGAGHLSDHEEYSYTPLLKAAQEKDLPVLVASPFPFGSSDNSHYQAGQIVHESGCITNNGMTMGAAISMFLLGLKQAEGLAQKGMTLSGQKRNFMRQWMTKERFVIAAEPSIVYPTRLSPLPSRSHKRAKALES